MRSSLLTLLALAALAASPGVVLAQGANPPGSPVELKGRLEVIVLDDLERGRSETRHVVKDAKGKRFELRFEGEPPGHLRSGDVVRARGRMKDGEVFLAADGDGSLEVEIAAAATVSGDQSTLVMVADFLDRDVSCSVDAVRDLMFTDPAGGSVADLFHQTSFGAVSFSGQVVGPYSIGYSSDACEFDAWGNAADAAARADGVDLDLYDRKVYVLPPNSCPVSGIGSVGDNPSRAWIFTCDLADAFAHELGHNLGMAHSSTPGSVYGDSSDIMSSGGKPLRQINAPHKEQLGWIVEDEMQIVVQDGVYEVAPLEIEPAYTSAPPALKIAKPDTNEYYYLSYRRPLGFDANLYPQYLENLSVHRHPGPSSGSRTFLLANLADGESFVDSANGITVTPLSHSAASITVDIRFDGQGPTCVPSAPTVAASPASQSGAAGDARAYTVAVTNRDGASCPASTFGLDASVPAGWSGSVSPSTLSLQPGETASATLWVTSSGSALDGSYPVSVDATDTADAGHAGSVAASYVVTTSCAAQSPSVSVSPASQVADSGATLAYGITLVNGDGSGCAATGFSLAGTIPAGWNGSVTPDTLTLMPGQQGSATFQVTSPASSAAGVYSIRLDAWDASDSSRGAARAASYEVAAPPEDGDTQPPNPPTGLQASAKRKHVNLSWTPATDDVGVVGYEVWRDGARIGTTTETAFTDRAPVRGATHVYSVVARDAAGNTSSPSSPASVTFGGSKGGGKGGGKGKPN